MMFFLWMILTVIFGVGISVIESAAKSGEQLTQEKCKKIDVIEVITAWVAVLVFMIGYYGVQQNPELFYWYDKVNMKVLTRYLMMFSGIYGMIMFLTSAIPYTVRKSQGNQQGGSSAVQGQKNEHENPAPQTTSPDKFETVLCPNCRRSQRKGNEKCWACGTALEGGLSDQKEATAQKEIVRAQVRVTPQQDMIVCPKCGKEQRSNRKCCWNCGIQFVTEDK